MAYTKRIILIVACTSVALGIGTDLTVLECLAVGITLFNCIIYFYTLGKKININELVLFITSVQIVFMPMITYIFHPEKMPLDSNTYLSYTVPAIVVFTLGFYVTFYKLDAHDMYLHRVREYLQEKQSIAFILFFIGLTGVFISYFMPIAFKNIANLFANCLYIAVLYGVYIKGKYKYFFFGITLTLMLIQTVQQGMFGQLFIWSLLWMSFLLVGVKWADTFRFKFTLMLCGILAIPVMQAVKFQYRTETWGNTTDERRGDAELMQVLILNHLRDYTSLLDPDILFGSFGRLNQGYLVATTMVHVPHYEPYADGEIISHFFYPFVPRLLWADKPITGGYDNMRRFANIENSANNSSNISPVGEGYVNFGKFGGIVFIFFYALLFNYIYQLILKLSVRRPSLILWIPSLFIATLSIETDVLTIWGTFVNGSIFLILFIHLLKRLNIAI